MDARPPGLIRLVLGLWITINLAMWFFGTRDAIWPPWPWKTDCQQLEASYESVLIHEGDRVFGPAYALRDLEAEGCIELD